MGADKKVRQLTKVTTLADTDVLVVDDLSNPLKGITVLNARVALSSEANTASNVGVGGVGLFKQKTGVDLEFKNINAGSSKVSVTDDVPNNEVDIDVVEANLTLDNLGGTLGIAKGGTGETSQTPAFDALAPTTTKGDIAVHDGSDNLRLPVGTEGQVMVSRAAQPTGINWEASPSGEANTASNVGSGGVGVFKQKTGVDLEFKNVNAGSSKITVTNDVGNNEIDIDVVEANLDVGNMTGTLPIPNGGTGQTTQAPAFDALAPTTTKGDLIVHTGSSNMRQAIGIDGQVLEADSGQASGINWVDKPLGIVTVTPGTDTNSSKSPYSSRSAGSTAQTYFSLNVPSDLSSVSRLYVRIIANQTFVTVDIDITLNTNALGELFSANSSTDTTSTYSFTIDEISEFDITALTGSVAAGDTIGIHFDHNSIGGTIHYLNAVLEYVRS